MQDTEAKRRRVYEFHFSSKHAWNLTRFQSFAGNTTGVHFRTYYFNPRSCKFHKNLYSVCGGHRSTLRLRSVSAPESNRESGQLPATTLIATPSHPGLQKFLATGDCPRPQSCRGHALFFQPTWYSKLTLLSRYTSLKFRFNLNNWVSSLQRARD